jgi:hypothetical protein
MLWMHWDCWKANLASVQTQEQMNVRLCDVEAYNFRECLVTEYGRPLASF